MNTAVALATAGPTVSMVEACEALGIGKSHGYVLASRGEFPARVLKLGGRYRVVTRSLLDLLDLAAPAA
jgi:predicted DNA-binding transcriptional regulator AlpA